MNNIFQVEMIDSYKDLIQWEKIQCISENEMWFIYVVDTESRFIPHDKATKVPKAIVLTMKMSDNNPDKLTIECDINADSHMIYTGASLMLPQAIISLANVVSEGNKDTYFWILKEAIEILRQSIVQEKLSNQ